jgi:acetyl-CoA carboxylase carboxyltransferase component
MSVHDDARRRAEAVKRGGAPRYHEQAKSRGKLFCRERIALLCDQGSFVEDGLLANAEAPDLPADGVVTGLGRVDGRPVAVMANDSTVKAGSWGARTVEKILRIQETALRLRVPLVYLVDSAGARITDQVEMFPGRRHAGHIFFNQTKLSGLVPQVCVLLGPSAAGGAYIPAFCDIVIMVEGNASMYLGSPRMAEMVIGEKVTLEEMGGARMHCTVSGCGDLLAQSESEAIELARRHLGYLPGSCAELPQVTAAREPSPARSVEQIVPENQNAPFDMNELLNALFDDVFPLKPLYAGEVITAFARLDGRPVGVVANQPRVKGGVLFHDSADKAARFIWLCDAFHLPLIFFADVPGFMIGTAVERAGIIRHGAKMIAAVSEATVPKICVVVRKAYGAGLYAMSGPGFEPDCTIALPTASIAVMGPEAAVNAVYANKIAELPEGERAAFVAEKRAEYAADIDIDRLASELIVDAVVPGNDLRQELVSRLALYAGREQPCDHKKHAVHPV